MDDFETTIVKFIGRHTDLEEENILSNLSTPPNPEMGDYAFPCFLLANSMKLSPKLIADKLAKEFKPNAYVVEAKSISGYLNFFANRSIVTTATIRDILSEKDKYGTVPSRNRNIVIDFSAPNIAKPFGIGHLRSTVIGNSVYKILTHCGYNVIGVNHLGDWGTQFGKLIVAFNKWGKLSDLKKDPIKYMYDLYVKFHKEAEKKKELDDQARAWFRKMEEGDKEAHTLLRLFTDYSLKEFKRLYSMLGVHFDHYTGESFYYKFFDKTLKLIKSKGITEESDGAIIVDLEKYKMAPCLLVKSDGATLYATRDISTAIYRNKTFKPEKIIYFTDARQGLHFRQFFKVIELMNLGFHEKLVHAPFGLLKFPDGVMSTRKGKMVLLEDVLNKAIDLALKTIKKKNPKLKNKEEVASIVGIGAVIFGDLSNDRVRDIPFDWKKILDFEGETAPYVQYTHARLCSIMRKSKMRITLATATKDLLTKLDNPLELNVIKLLRLFPQAVSKAGKQYKPHIVARYVLDLCQAANTFYHDCPVLKEKDKDLVKARLVLIKAVTTVIALAMSLLGIKVPDEM